MNIKYKRKEKSSDLLLAEKLQDIRFVCWDSNYGIFKDYRGYFFANYSDNFIVNLKTKIKGSKDDIFKLYRFFARTGRLDLKLVKKDLRITKGKKYEKLKYTPFVMDREIFDLMEFS